MHYSVEYAIDQMMAHAFIGMAFVLLSPFIIICCIFAGVSLAVEWACKKAQKETSDER